MEGIAPLLTRIQALKGGKGGALSGIQLMAFFMQRRVQPCSIAFPSFGAMLAWWILLASLEI
jgi:hypothetical protein